jgi:hypothetical protein
MQAKIIWQQGSDNPDNANHLAAIKQWWSNLHDKKITWRQRLIPQVGDVSTLDWEPQRFDEEFNIQMPQVRGITLFWHKPESKQERSTTPRRLEFDESKQQLYIYPQSQKELVIRVSTPEIIYQKIEIKNPQWQGINVGENYILTLRDEQQKLEIKLILSPSNLEQLKAEFPDY